MFIHVHLVCFSTCIENFLQQPLYFLALQAAYMAARPYRLPCFDVSNARAREKGAKPCRRIMYTAVPRWEDDFKGKKYFLTGENRQIKSNYHQTISN